MRCFFVGGWGLGVGFGLGLGVVAGLVCLVTCYWVWIASVGLFTCLGFCSVF